ncbi:MAG: leucine-rich repeat domain-containing protein [Oscillospiraceae bacterium]|jgi:Leucine-rich repeat (LRR) protein|nr:leucine-rich repeat domain-containing protein [Oscillospiraceae bacterium]
MIKRLLIIIASAALLVFILWLLLGSRVASLYYSAAVAAAVADNRPERAVELLERHIALRPDDRALKTQIASLLVDLERFSRAEYHLLQSIELAGPAQAAAYLELCRVYVLQDKLLDAVLLLDGVTGLNAEAVAQARPAAPVFTPAPGTHSSLIAVTVTAQEGVSCFVALGETPSAAAGSFTGEIALPPGTSVLTAVAVSNGGVVSPFSGGEYILENVNYLVAFEDKAAEGLIREALGRPSGDIYSRELSVIREIDNPNEAYYATLADFALLPNLRSLSLVGTGRKTDLSALSSLTSLQTLSLQTFSVDSLDLEYMANLAFLQELDLSGNHITSLAHLAGLTRLRALNLSSNAVIDIAPLAGLAALTELDLSLNSVQDLAPLANLTALQTLNLSRNRVFSLAGLERLVSLEWLDVSVNSISTLEPLAALTSLKELYASHNKLPGIASIRPLTALTHLDISVNDIESISSLSGATGLTRLAASQNRIGSLDALKNCAALEYLDVNKNEIVSLDPLEGLPSLTELRAEQNYLRTLAPLKSCPGPLTVYAFGNDLTDPPSLFDGTNITVISRS